MAENNKKFRINFFDVVIVVIVACVVIAAYVFLNRGETAAATKKLTYKIELNETTPGMENYIRIATT